MKTTTMTSPINEVLLFWIVSHSIIIQSNPRNEIVRQGNNIFCEQFCGEFYTATSCVIFAIIIDHSHKVGDTTDPRTDETLNTLKDVTPGQKSARQIEEAFGGYDWYGQHGS